MCDEECSAEYHEFSPLSDPYFKIKFSVDWIDWLLGTEKDLTKSYIRLSCIHCCANKEVICEDHSPATKITVIHKEEQEEE